MRCFRLLPRYRRKHRRCAHTFAIICVACGSIVSLRIRGRAPIGHEHQHRDRDQQRSRTCHIRFSSGVIDDHKRVPLHKHGRPPTTNRGTDACRAIWQAHPKRPASRVPPLQPISSSSWEPHVLFYRGSTILGLRRSLDRQRRSIGSPSWIRTTIAAFKVRHPAVRRRGTGAP